MSLFESFAFAKRAVALGPDDQLTIVLDIKKKLAENKPVMSLAEGLTGVFSLLVAVLLASVFVWRRSLVNRVSLRLIFAISVCDFMQCLAQAVNQLSKNVKPCQAERFLLDFFFRASMYLSSAIAFNLQMAFHRKSQIPLPRYVEYLYYIISFGVALIQAIVHVSLAVSNGVCDMFNTVPNASVSYIVYVVFQCMLIQSISVFYNVFASTAVIITLYFRQRRVNKALESVSSSTRELLDAPRGSDTTGSRAIAIKEVERLSAARKVYFACMRIALYPLAPLIWWILIVVYYVLQYPITLTYKSDVHKMVKLMFFSWFAYPGVALINFAVFVTDPAVAKVVSEVRIEIKRRLAERRMRATSSQDTLSGSKDDIEKLPDMALSDSLGSGTVHDDTRTDCSLGVERHDSRGDAVVGRTGALEDGLLFTTSASYVYNDNVIRRIRADGDANNFMDAL